MKAKVLLLTILLMPLSTLAANDRSKDREVEYKCHLELANGKQVVHYLMSKKNYTRQLEQKMKGQSIFAKDGVTRKPIFKVMECAKAKEEFKTFDARLMDKETLS